MDFTRMLRMQNVFQQPQQPQQQSPLLPGLQDYDMGSPGGQPQQQGDLGDASFGDKQVKAPKISISTDFDGIKQIADMIQEIANPQSGMQEQLQQHVQDYPIQQPASRMTKFIAAMQGGAAGDAMEAYKVLDRPQDRAIADWKNKVQPMQNLATNENSDNAQNRMIANTAATTFIGNKRADTAQQLADEKERANLENERVRNIRAAAYAYKSYNPQNKIYAVRGGNLMAFDPITKQITDLGVPSGMLADDVKLGIQAEDAESLEEIRQRHRLEIVQEQGKNAIATKSTPTSGASGASQVKAERENKARELASNPTYAPYIVFDNSNRFVGVVLPKKGNKATLDKINAEIFQGKNDAPTGGATIPGVSAGNIPVYDATGKLVGQVPAGSKQEQLPVGHFLTPKKGAK